MAQLFDNLPAIGRGGRTSQNSTVPFFLVEPVMLDRERWLEVTCQRKDCKRMHMVRERAWRESRPNYITRSCPYCFKVGRIPPKRTKKRRQQ